MHEFDQFVKHELKVKNYTRYTDDFVVVANNPRYLEQLRPSMQEFLVTRLKLKLHHNKITLHSAYRGVDFLGYVIFPHWRLLRSRTRRRILKKLRRGPVSEQSLQSYLGVLSHANTYKLSRDLRNQFWLK